MLPGSTAVFAAEFDRPATYQWRHNFVNLTDSARITGATTGSLSIADVRAFDEGQYDCVVISDCGARVSRVAELSCRPRLLQQPPAVVRLVAGARLSVGVPQGTSATYRWRRNGQSLFNVPGTYSGVTTATLTILREDPALAGSFDVVLSSECGVITSSPAEVVCTPEITSQPPARLAMFRGAELTVGTPPPGEPGAPSTIRWLRNGVPIADSPGLLEGTGAVTLCFVVEDLSLDGRYSVVLSNACGSITSSEVLVICDQPTILTQPSTATRLAQGAAVHAGVPVDSGYTFRWRQRAVGGQEGSEGEQDLFDIPGLFHGAATDTLVFETIDPSLAGVYSCRVTSPCGATNSNEGGVYCAGDFNRDLRVDLDDLADFVTCYFAVGCEAADFNADGHADADDLSDFISMFFDGSCR